MNFDSMFSYLLLFSLALLVLIGIMFLVSNHDIEYYYIGQSGYIQASVDWMPDTFVYNEKVLSAKEAMAIVDSLNIQLQKSKKINDN